MLMMNDVKKREARRMRIIRARLKGEPWIDIAEREQISRQRCRQIHDDINQPPPNPDGEPRRYSCKRCTSRFTSTAKSPPARCPECRTYRWR